MKSVEGCTCRVCGDEFTYYPELKGTNGGMSPTLCSFWCFCGENTVGKKKASSCQGSSLTSREESMEAVTHMLSFGRKLIEPVGPEAIGEMCPPKREGDDYVPFQGKEPVAKKAAKKAPAKAAAAQKSKYEIVCRVADNGQYYYVIRTAGNHEIRLKSEEYTRKETMREYAREFALALKIKTVTEEF